MNSIFLFLILTLAQLSLYFYLKDNIHNFSYIYYIKISDPQLSEEIISNSAVKPINEKAKKVVTLNLEESKHIILNKKLRHLEFISEFEMYLEDKNYKMFPIEFLQEFEKIKKEAQLSLLQSTNQLVKPSKLAA